MRIERVRIVRRARGAAGDAAAALLGDAARVEAATVLKHEGRAWVRRARVNDVELVVKCRPLHSVRRRVASLLGLGHAHRQWSGAERLRTAGIPTGAPLLIARGLVDDEPAELLVVEFVEGPTLLEVLASVARDAAMGVRRQHAIARAAGEQIAQLLAARLWNRDHKPSNLVVLDARAAERRVAIIDCVAIRRYGWMGLDEGEVAEMLASLMIESIGCGCPPRRALWMRVLHALSSDATPSRPQRHEGLRATIEAVELLIDSHGDPRPRVNPLAPTTAPSRRT